MQRRLPSSRLVDLILQSCGYGKQLECSNGTDILLPLLLERGVDAHVLKLPTPRNDHDNSTFFGRYVTGSFLELPFPDEHVETVIAIGSLDSLPSVDVPSALKEIYRVTSRFAFLRVSASHMNDEEAAPPRDRAWWETRCFEVGFRKHPLYYQINPYESLNNEDDDIFILLEKVPPVALQQYDLTVLVEERLLHTDMLRETGRRSDAHCIRYHKAVEYIRPGDRVLDVACGLGYGSHILYTSSKARSVVGVDLSDFSIDYANAHYAHADAVRFEVGDAQTLSQIADNSIDFITAFETIEHIPDPHAYLSELKRVLKPSGRLMVCAPNNWVDETGKDPNPYHLHVYTWERLIDDCGAYFLLEKGFFQTAGGAMRYHHSPRSWVDVQPEKEREQDGEWVLLLCMADPLKGKTVPYEETAWSLPASSEFHVSAFARDYDNPWLVKSVVTMGMRVQSETLLDNIQQNVLVTADRTSTDFGAALCGHIYALKRHTTPTESQFQELREAILQYAAIASPTPHQLRWQVSLLFVGGELAKKLGKTDHARDMYSRCAIIDVLPYSPLLGNKTLDALYQLAVLAIVNHDTAGARSSLQKSVTEAQRLVSGSWLNIIGTPEKPLSFSFPEISQLMDKAARAVYMLDMLDESKLKPGLFYQESSGFFERQLAARDARIESLDSTVQELASKVLDAEANVRRMGQQIIDLDANAQELARQVIASDERAQELGSEVVALDQHAQELAKQVVAKTAQNQELTEKLERRTSPKFIGNRLRRIFGINSKNKF
ncbi:class I SAM-dependent methyltransferase [Brucella intermedia]|uniref:class I SAM-dependent methyltransferase n=1 Tax=Brucella intermedia TaxID=94625 RepID=UPI00124D9F17|nr:class I SAM-dependent methyltransferase [Brucella intermedia]KAB2729723.1 methyltransferase domain-containing protein [Brucella intermedia]